VYSTSFLHLCSPASVITIDQSIAPLMLSPCMMCMYPSVRLLFLREDHHCPGLIQLPAFSSSMWPRHFLLFDPRLQITPSGSVKIGNGILGGGTLQNSEESIMERVMCRKLMKSISTNTPFFFLYFFF
jgi:hypothetical protein